LQCNSVTAIELVTADAEMFRVDATHEPELFWALRGGGGNFGVVTGIEFDVFPQPDHSVEDARCGPQPDVAVAVAKQAS